MAEQPTNSSVNPTALPAGTGDQSATPRLFTQEEVNALIGATRIEEREKNQRRVASEYGDLDTLKAAKAKLDELEAANLTETEKLKREVEAAKQREATAAQKAVDAERAALRLKVGQLKGLPVVLAERLQGDTEDEMAADADRLLAELGQTAKPKPPNLDATAGAGGGGGARKPALTPGQQAAARAAHMTDDQFSAAMEKLEEGQKRGAKP